MKKWAVILLMLLPVAGLASEGTIELKEAPVDLHNKASLQNGAKLYVNYCMGCHSMKYLRYGRLAKDLGLKDDVVLKNLVFTGDRIGDLMENAIRPEDAEAWFGTTPPDLTYEARLRSPDWIYTYLLSFYTDFSRPTGANNKLFPKVAMPDVLYNMRNSMSEEEFKKNMGDLVNFMTYAAEPIRTYREHLGVYVLIFLVILLIPAYLMKREFWKDVH